MVLAKKFITSILVIMISEAVLMCVFILYCYFEGLSIVRTSVNSLAQIAVEENCLRGGDENSPRSSFEELLKLNENTHFVFGTIAGVTIDEEAHSAFNTDGKKAIDYQNMSNRFDTAIMVKDANGNELNSYTTATQRGELITCKIRGTVVVPVYLMFFPAATLYLPVEAETTVIGFQYYMGKE